MLGKTKFLFIPLILFLSMGSNTFSMVPFKAKQETPKTSILAIFQQIFTIKNEASIKIELEKMLRDLKEKDEKNESITENDSLLIKNVWNQFKSLYSYNWIDRITNPFRKAINEEELIKLRNKRPFTLLLHSDKYSLKNKEKMDELFKAFGDVSRPHRATDGVAAAILDLTIDYSMEIGVCLANKAFPSIFRDREFEKELLFPLEKQIDYHSKNITFYKSVIEKKNQVIQHKLKQCKDMIDMHFMKNRRSK